MANIVLKNICKTYDKKQVVKNLNLEIGDGEFAVLVGPSGCGKSTTLRMIAGLEAPTEGEIYIDGKLVNDVPAGMRDIAMVFQNYAIYPTMTVRGNIEFGLKNRKVPKAERDQLIHDVCEIVGLTEYLNRKPSTLSGGQRQRVALARAMVKKPSVFLMDEPLSNLDAKLRTQMRSELIELHQRLHTTFVYVTHDQVEAMSMGSKIIVMNEGVKMQDATPLEVYHQPRNIFAAQFIGTPPMNIFDVASVGTWEGCAPEGCQKVGFRPEKIRMHEPDTATDDNEFFHLEASVVTRELLGAEAVYSLQSKAGSLQVKTHDSYLPEPGEPVRISIRKKDIFFFSEDGKRIEKYCRRTGVIRCGGLRRSTRRTLTPSVKPCASWNEPVISNVAASVAACAELCTRSTSSRKQSQHPKTCTGFAYIG